MKKIWLIIILTLFTMTISVFSSHAGEVKSIRGGHMQNNVADSVAIRDLKKNALKKIHDGNRRNWERMSMTSRYNEKTLTQPNRTPAFIGKKRNIAIEDVISPRGGHTRSLRGGKQLH